MHYRDNLCRGQHWTPIGGQSCEPFDRPEIPLHTNGSENDIRAHVTKRKISGGTKSDPGRVARDVLLGLMKTCAKLGLSFFAYLGERLGVPDAATVPRLAQLVRTRATA